MITKPESANRLINMSEQTRAWLRYSFNARHSRGHGVHSPFVFDFITSVLNDRNKYKACCLAEEYRKLLKKNKTHLGLTGFGAGSRACLSQKSIVADIAKHASVNRKFGQLLFRLARHYKPDLIIELGTSLGISTLYLALGNPDAKVTTIEAEPALAAIAVKGLKDYNLTNVSLINDTFDHVLPSLLPQLSGETLVFIDGNHSRSATLEYAGFFLSALTEGSLIILDDINWSEGMRQAWKEIQTHEKSSLTIDLFSMGIVFIKRDFFMENYTIRF